MDLGIIVAVVAIAISVWQAREAARSYRSGVLLSLMQQWNDPTFYVSVSYVHALRKGWKEESGRDGGWNVRRFIDEDRFRLAKEWVDTYAPRRAPAGGTGLSTLQAEWEHRRKVSQFISMMGYMLKARYLNAGDFFAIIPEVKRLLIVLEPIEYWITEEYKDEPMLDPDWDRPFGKVGFDYIHGKYINWLRGVTGDGKEHLSRLENIKDRPGEYL
jgi:hypothetical protein